MEKEGTKIIDRSYEVTCVLCRWDVEPGECSAACGRGVMLRKVKCRKTILRSKRYKQVEDRHCATAPRAQPRPADRVPCLGRCQHTHWGYDQWSKVRVGGERVREREKKGEGSEVQRKKRKRESAIERERWGLCQDYSRGSGCSFTKV